MKQYIKYICAFLMAVGTSTSAWGTTETIDLSQSGFDWPTDYVADNAETHCTYGAYTLTISNTKRQAYGGVDGVIMRNSESGSYTAGYIKLPEFPATVTSVTITSLSSTAASTVDLYAGDTKLGYFALTKDKETSKTFDGLSVTSGTILKIIVHSSSNAQLKSISVTHGGAAMPTRYSITYHEVSGGTTSGPPSAVPGATVNFTVTPDDGYFCDGTYVYDESYLIMDETLDPGVYSFTMPSVNVHVYPFFSDCAEPTLTLSSSSKTMNFGDGSNTFTITKTTNSTGTITWSSTNTTVATVAKNGSDNGVVTVKAAGTSTIKCNVASAGGKCAKEVSFSLTVNAIAPTLSHNTSSKELTASNITSTGVRLTGGVVTNKGGGTITRYGFVIGTSADVTLATKVKEAGWSADIAANTKFGYGDFSGLTPNTTYYARVYATNSGGTGYSSAISFNTLQRYVITYYKNDGGATTATEYKDHGVNYTISSDKFSRDGYTLSKWHTLAAGTGGTDYAKGATYTANEALNLYAVWAGTISFNANGGSGSMDAQVLTSGSSYELPACAFTAPSGKLFKCWAEGSSSGTERAVGYSHTVTSNITFYAKWRDAEYTDARFSCAELTLTGPTGNLVFITSAANKTVRSQEAFHIEGSGLSASQSITFTHSNSTAASKFAYKKADGTALATDASGEIDTDFYIYYTPASGDTGDGLDEFTDLQAKVTEGLKPKTSNILDSKTVIGRHLPADFVIAAKYDNKWYALPANMAETSHPAPVEIAVDDVNDPSVAYTAASNKYGLEGPASGNISDGNGQYVKLTMSPLSNAPLFGQAPTNTAIGKSGDAIATNKLSEGWWWKLKQTNTSISNPQDAKYIVHCANNSSSLSIKNDPFQWGLYASGVEELRLIPASSIIPTEAYFVEWGQHGGVIEVDAGGVGATKVQAVLNGTESAVKTLSQTCTSVKNRASIYNYTLNFNDVGHVIDFAASTSNGAMLTLRWLDGGENLVAVSNITVPKIVATNTSMSSIESGDTPWSKWEVHVLPGVTLTANAGSFSSGDVTIKNLEIYQGATVKVTTGTLDVTNLVLRNGWSRAGSKRYDVARVHIATTANLTHTNAYADWYIDYDQYYPMAVPWDVTVSGISYRYTSLAATVGHDKNIRLRYYDGALRVNGGNGTGTNWRLYGDAGAESVPATLKPSQGYAITAKRAAGKAFAIVRMPLTFADTWTALGEQGRTGEEVKDTVHVVAHGVGANPAKPWYAVGWNFIGNPYMSCFDSNESDFMNKLIAENGGSVKYATIPDTEFEGFDQVNIASVGNKLKPSSGFFVQVGSTGSLRFKQGQIITPSAPARYTNEQEAIPEQEAFILLNGEQGHDQMGLVIGSDYTADYEMNADLSKMLGNANIVKTWMRYTDMDMAYVAINEQLAREWIPVTVHIPAEGEYIYSLMNSSTVDELEGLYLIDYETGAITNLIYDEYIFTAEAGTQSGRFAINAIVGERKVPTGADITGVDKNGNEPVKFIWHDKVYILHNSVIYDATGKCVNVINK